MKLDRAGIDYIVAVAADAGFVLRKCETTEEYRYAPEVTLTFEQTREPKPPEKPLFKDADVRGLIAADQAAGLAREAAREAKEKSARTLDE